MIKIMDDNGKEVWINPLKVVFITKKFVSLEGDHNIFFADDYQRQIIEHGVTGWIADMFPPR